MAFNSSFRVARVFSGGKKAEKRRGGKLPARLRFSCREGHTLVELLIGFLILTIVCLSWFEMMGFQNWTKESARREAVERLHGMMDAFVDIVPVANYSVNDGYEIMFNVNAGASYSTTGIDYVVPMRLEASPSIGYRLYLEKAPVVLRLPNTYDYWGSGSRNSYWLRGELYNQCDTTKEHCGQAFCKMKVFIGGSR